MRLPSLLFLLLSLFTQPAVFSQEVPRYRDSLLQAARSTLDTLTSEFFYGRGYQQNGHEHAATYLENRFRQIGLQPLEGDYQQPFDFRLNVVTGCALSLDEHSLVPGKDFIVNAQSGAGEINLRVLDLEYGLKVKEKAKNKVVIIREGLPDRIQNDARKRTQFVEMGRDEYKLEALTRVDPAAVIIVRKKLTAALRPDAYPFPVLEILADAFPEGKIKMAHLRVDSDIRQVRTQNVLGYLPGTGNSDSVVLVTAHYDHLGGYSEAIFRGANDNASGITMLLSMAEHFVKNPPEKNMLFIAFGAEEAGLQGSAWYVFKDPRVPLSKMKFILNLDLMGNGVDGIMAVGGKDFPGFFDQLVALNDTMKAVPRVRARQNAPNSDHYFFLDNGVPGFFIYTMGGPSHYHDVNDTAKNLLFSKYVEVRALLIRFLEGL